MPENLLLSLLFIIPGSPGFGKTFIVEVRTKRNKNEKRRYQTAKDRRVADRQETDLERVFK